MLTQADLRQFTGTEAYHKFNLLWPNYVLTDGTYAVAKELGAYWLMEAIASHQPALKKYHKWANEIQFWHLEVNGSKAILSVQEDSGKPKFVNQRIEYTDFPFSIDIWFQNNVLFLPSEY